MVCDVDMHDSISSDTKFTEYLDDMKFGACVGMDLPFAVVDFAPSINYKYEELQVPYNPYIE